MTIRRLGPDDAEASRAIRLSALATSAEAFGSTLEREAAFPLSAFADRLASSTVLGVFEGGAIAGIAGLRRHDGPKETHKATVWGVFIEPRSRGRGLARLLLTSLLEGVERGVEQVLLTVSADNRAAIALYESLGFERYGVEPRALKTATGDADEVLMIRRSGVDQPASSAFSGR